MFTARYGLNIYVKRVYCAVRTVYLHATQISLNIQRPSHGSGGKSPASHCGSPGLIPCQSMWDLCWTEWHWDRFFSQYICFPSQYHSTNAPQSSSSTRCSYWKNKWTTPGNFPKKQSSFGNWGTLDRKLQSRDIQRGNTI